MSRHAKFAILVAVQTVFTVSLIFYFMYREVKVDRPPLDFSHYRRDGRILIGYFHGGRTVMLYRTQVYKEFENEGVNVGLVTKRLRQHNYFLMPNMLDDRNLHKKNLGKATGEELVNLVDAGQLEGATIGETAFIRAVAEGHPIVAVAELGHDVKDGAGHAIVLHKDIKVQGPESLRGLKFGARRSAGGDEVMLREFLRQQGLQPGRDVRIIPDIQDDVFGEMLAARQIDGAYGHVLSIRKWIQKYKFPVYIHRPLNWVNPELSNSVLVFSKKFVAENPEQVQKIVNAYVRQIRKESRLPESVRKERDLKGLEIAIDFEGLNVPEYRLTPFVQTDLLNEWQDFLVTHEALPKKVDLTDFIDHSFVQKADRETRL